MPRFVPSSPRRPLLSLMLAIGLACLPGMSTGVSDGRPENVLQELYDDFSWEEGGLMGGDDYLFDLDSASLRSLFEEDLVNGILSDQRCRVQLKGGCKLDRSPLWASDDPGFRDLKLVRVHGNERSSPIVIRVTFSTPRQRSSWSVDYTLTRTSKGWRITDAVAQGGRSLRSLLLLR